MTIKQNILKLYYPLLMEMNKASDKNVRILHNKDHKLPLSSVYNLKSIDNSGNEISFDQFPGKKILIVNTASDCGYTAQYDDLEKLFCNNKEKLTILAFPSNDFGNQESGSDIEIAKFCKDNYKITFPIMKKSHVLKTPDQNPVYEWLTDANKNGWNDRRPDWNFCKYLVNEEGVLTHYFGPAISPEKVLGYI